MKSKDYSNDHMLNITLWSTVQNAEFATAVQAQLKNAYMNVNIKTVQFSVISQMMGTNGTGWDGMIVMLGGIDPNPMNYYNTLFSKNANQYVPGIDRTIVIKPEDLKPEYAKYAGKTIPELYEYALTTQNGDSVQALRALTY